VPEAGGELYGARCGVRGAKCELGGMRSGRRSGKREVGRLCVGQNERMGAPRALKRVELGVRSSLLSDYDVGVI
jgi:hypothetical protein